MRPLCLYRGPPWLTTDSAGYVMLVMLRGKTNNIEFERNRKVLCLQVVWVWVCESGSVCLLKVAASSAGPGRVTERDSAWRDVTRPAAGLLMSCIAAISATRSRQECSANIIYLGHTTAWPRLPSYKAHAYGSINTPKLKPRQRKTGSYDSFPLSGDNVLCCFHCPT